MPKQLINVLGAVIVAAILAAGVVLIGVPIYLQAVATGALAAQVAQSNDAYQAQVDKLTAEKKAADETSANVATLEAQIPATTRSDDVFEIVAKAASAAGVTVVDVTVGDPEAWAPRSGVDDSASAQPSKSGKKAASPGADTSSTGAATSNGDTSAAVPTTPQQQVPISISIATDDSARAAAFLDHLGMGPRLIGIVGSTLSGTDGAFTLDVEALSFIRTES